jgi:TPR repeat protein
MNKLRSTALIAALLTSLAVNYAAAQTTNLSASVMQAAEAGDPSAQAILGQRYIDGRGVLQDYAAAVTWLTLAAEAGDVGAINNLGKLYFEGLGVQKDVKGAIAWLEKSAQSGTPEMLFDLATVLETTQEDVNLIQAHDLYTRGAAAGHVPSAVNLGVMYQNGSGVARDVERAKELYEIGVAAEHPRALNNLGLLYVRGEGVAQDYSRAADLFKRAAEQGVRPALRNLGVLFENGFGVPRDKEQADALYRLAGTGEINGSAAAQIVYDPRLLPPVTTPKGIAAIEAAAFANDPIALFQAGWIIVTHPNAALPQWREASALFNAAALRGHGPAMTNLSLMYFQGKGVPQDFMLGQMWLLLAKYAGAETGLLEATFSGKPTPSQINEAQNRAKDLLATLQAENLPND